jgi:Legionella pneumophila major outer membrane protein precursor
MRCGRTVLTALALGLLPLSAWSDPPSQTNDDTAGPSNLAVQLPPQVFDGPVKAPNTTREHYGEWSVSGGVLFLQPVFETNPAFTVSSAGGNFTRQVDFSQHFDASPNIWLGYSSERGWGVRGRWFEFDGDTSESYVSAAGETIRGVSFLTSGQTSIAGAAFASSHLRVNVFDIQGTSSWESAFWTHLVGFGVRITTMNQSYQAALTNPAEQIGLTSNHDFSGAGPCFSLETKYRLGESGFAIYGQIYGAILFGDVDEDYAAVKNGIAQGYTRSTTEVLPVAEMELGVEYQHCVGRAKLFVQGGFTGQVWWGGGNASNLDALGTTSAAHSNFGFFGAALRAGVRY